MSSDSGTENQVVRELGTFFEPVITAGQVGPAGVYRFLSDAGIADELEQAELGKLLTILGEDLMEPAATIAEKLLDGEPDLSDIIPVIEACVEIHSGIKKANDLSFQSSDLEDVGDAILDYLIYKYLESEHYFTFNIFILLGVLDQYSSGTGTEFRPQKIETLVEDPAAGLLDTYNVADSGIALDFELLSYGIAELFAATGVTAITYPLDRKAVQAFSTDVPSSITKPKNAKKVSSYSQYRFPLLSGPSFQFGLNLIPIPHPVKSGNETTYEGIDGLALQPYGTFKDGFSTSFGPNNERTFSTSVSASENDWLLGVMIDNQKLEPKVTSKTGSKLPSLSAKAELENLLGFSGSGTQLLGTSDGTGIRLTGLSIGGSAKFENDSLQGGIELPTSGRVMIDPKGGFLAKVLPDEVESDFEMLLGWSSEKGLYFEGGATLAVPLPMHEKIGPITLKEIYLAVTPKFKEQKVTAEGSAAATVKLGPITGTVDRMGIETEIELPKQDSGNLGPLDLDVGFKPPNGVGLSLSAGPVQGSGYLGFYPDEHRYEGAAQLKVSEVTATALGLITTEMPDGSDGFSMQVIIAGQFPPIQLGFGFTLLGVGGLAGINRKFRKKPLRNVVRKGNLDSILFPKRETVKNNPQRLLSDIRSIFPPKEGSHVFGPMLQLGFGTPAVLKASLGVVLEIPSFRVAILGRFGLVLPNHEAEKPAGMGEQAPFPPVELHLDVTGIIDIPGKSISVDGTLYDSRIVNWTAEGDLALRSRWGGTDRFLLSIGGFHPRYTPPKDAPGLKKLDRVKVNLDVPGGQPVVKFTGYLAVTSNTFQVGAKVYAELQKGKFKIWGTIEFDALFRFEPFEFVISFKAKYMIEAGNYSMGFSFDGTAKGPNPFNIHGTVKLKLGPMKVNKTFDVTLGSEKAAEPLPPAEVLPKLRGALRDSRNWRTELPETGGSAVSLRGSATGAGGEGNGGDSGESEESPETAPVVAHPRGTLTVEQTVVPLEYGLEKFGENEPKTYEAFRINRVSVAGASDANSTDVTGEFAPVKYKKMSDSEKLKKPDFVEKRSGTTVGDEEPLVGGVETLYENVEEDESEEEGTWASNATRASFVYEELIEDEGVGTEGESVESVTGGTMNYAKRTHTEHTAKRFVEGRVGSSGRDGSRFAVRDRHGPNEGDEGSASGIAFSVVQPEYVIVEDPPDLTPGTTASVVSGTTFSKEEAHGRIEALKRTNVEMDTDRLRVMRKDRAKTESWIDTEGVEG